jgi:hypothetical protein
MAGGLLSTPSIVSSVSAHLSYGSCLIIVGVAMMVLIPFRLGTLAVLLGVTSPSRMAAVVIGAIILGAAWLQAKLSERPF